MSKINKVKRVRKDFPEVNFHLPHNRINKKPFGKTFHASHSFIGAYIDRKLVDLTSLYCVYIEESKTTFLKKLLQEQVKNYPSEKEMMEDICITHLEYWINYLEAHDFEEVKYKSKKDALWKEYKAELKSSLYKTIPKFYANFVITYIEEAQF